MMTRKTFRIGLSLIAMLAMTGCGIGARVATLTGGNANLAVGLPYKGTLSTGDDIRDFTVVVEAGGATLEEARESIRYPGTTHCVDRFGSSEIVWTTDPVTGDWAVTRTEDGDLIATGRCVAR